MMGQYNRDSLPSMYIPTTTMRAMMHVKYYTGIIYRFKVRQMVCRNFFTNPGKVNNVVTDLWEGKFVKLFAAFAASVEWQFFNVQIGVCID